MSGYLMYPERYGPKTMPLSIVQTDRLRLERPAARDLPALASMHTDPRVMATLGGALWDENQSAIFLERLMAHWRTHGFGWWIVRNHGGEFMGRGGLRFVIVDGEPSIEIGYGFRAEAWGQGYATELAKKSLAMAVEALKVKTLVSFTLPSNQASRRVMEKTGLRYERDVTYANLPHVLYRWRSSL